MQKKNQQSPIAIRYNNQKEILKIMSNGSYSCTDLAKIMKLSNTAVENIVDELLLMNILVRAEDQNTGRPGRRPIKFHINGELGVVASVDLADRDLVVCIANLNRQILYRAEVKNVIIITRENLEAVAAEIRKGMEEPGLKGKNLFRIGIATPGLIDKNTGYYTLAPRIEDYEHLNIADFFHERFGCPVVVANDIVSGLRGEMQFGVLGETGAKNAIFMHFDINIGLAYLFEGRIYEGNNGHAGELGFFVSDYKQPLVGLGSTVSLTAVYIDIKERLAREKIAHPFAGKDVLDADEVKLLFLAGDEIVVSAFRHAAKNLAITFLNLAYLLDIQQIVIEGKIVDFGNKFLEYVNYYIEKYNQLKSKITVSYSALMSRAITLGCISHAVHETLEELLLLRPEN